MDDKTWEELRRYIIHEKRWYRWAWLGLAINVAALVYVIIKGDVVSMLLMGASLVYSIYLIRRKPRSLVRWDDEDA